MMQSKHNELQNKHNKNWMKKQENKGLCIFCKNKSLEHSKMCERHYMLSKATSNLKNRKLSEEITELFYLQNSTCYLTGRNLILGLNAGIDHIIPRSRTKELITDIRNIRWVDKDINNLKKDMTYDELIALCTEILDNHTLKFKNK